MKLLILSLLLITASAQAEEFLWSPTYDSVDEAATAALEVAVDWAGEHKRSVEYGGVLYEMNGKYLFTVPQTNGRRTSMVADVKYPAAAKLVGLYHNHPAGKGSERFSAIDINTAEELGVSSYIAIEGTGIIKVFHPGKSRTTGVKQLQSQGEFVSTFKGEHS